MLNFLTRRLAAGLVTLVVALFLMFVLVDAAVDPLQDLVESTDPNKEQLIALRIEQLRLDVPSPLRFFEWFGGLLTGDLGTAWRSGRPVSELLVHAAGSTLELVTAATFISLIVGVAVGIVSALRQYSSFDYLIIFLSFLLYSLPSFWVAVLLKQWAAIGFNDFLRDPVIAWPVIVGLSLLTGLLWSLAIGGAPRRRLQVFGLAAAANLALLAYIQLTGWWDNPQIGPVLILLLGAGSAFAVAGVFAGLHNRRALWTGLTVVAIGVALYFPVQVFFDSVTESHWLIAGMALLTAGVGYLVGRLYGGPDWRLSARTGAAVALVVGALTFVDQVLQVWRPYFQALSGRPIPTFGDRTPNLGGNYWVQVLDAQTHLILPTATLVLIAFASYTRYSRSSMLEVMSQDYIRTARAKGLPERLVVVRHGFRNALIPLATVVPIDIITLLGGAIITENVFGRPGMGQLFVRSLENAEIEPVMGYLLVTASLAIIANIVADMVYASIDPRIRLDA